MKLLRKLVIPATVVASLLLTTPAWASWNTMDEGDPFQVVHSCHDGLVLDWASDPVLYSNYKTYDPATEVKKHNEDFGLGTNHDFWIYRPDPNGVRAPHVIGQGSREIPYHPTVLSGFSEDGEMDGTGAGQYIHLLEGAQTYLYAATDWQPTTPLGQSTGVQMTYHDYKTTSYWVGLSFSDCYVAAPIQVLRTSAGATTIAFSGSSHLPVANLPASSFVLKAAGASVGTVPSAGSLRDVNGDGFTDLVLTYPVGLGSGLATYTVTGKTASGGFLQGHFTHRGVAAAAR